MQEQIPHFANQLWYRNPTDHHCPHDAWLESIEVKELAQGTRQEQRTTVITIRLLGAYHDGHIVFRYSGVTKYTIDSQASARGVGDWNGDQFSLSPDGLWEHSIAWCRGAHSKSEWFIVAEGVTYEWIPIV